MRRRRRTKHFNPLPPRGGRRDDSQERKKHHTISIHSLLAEGDVYVPQAIQRGLLTFQSTPSSRRETKPTVESRVLQLTISIHSLLAEGDQAAQLAIPTATISIHSLLAEGDVSQIATVGAQVAFQSTPSSRRETVASGSFTSGAVISIHSLLAEGDSNSIPTLTSVENFNPLPPRGGRRDKLLSDFRRIQFQSTPSSRRETWQRFTSSNTTLSNFNPLPPRGGRRQTW